MSMEVPSLPQRVRPVDAGAFGCGGVDAQDLGFDDDLAFRLVDAMQQFLDFFNAMGRVDDNDSVSLRLEVHYTGAGAEHRHDQLLDLFDVVRAEVAELIMELRTRQLAKLCLSEGVDSVAFGMQGKAIHEGKFFHLLERISII